MSNDHVHAVTDLVLGVTVLVCAWRLSRLASVHRYWKLAFWFAAASSVAGALHHGLLRREESWISVGVLVVIALSYLLVGSAHQVLGLVGRRTVLVIRVVGLVAYGVFVVAGNASLGAMLLAESLTMATILGLWVHAARRGHPSARPVIRALLAFGLAGVVFVLPVGALTPAGIDATSLTHLALIPGMVLLYGALRHMDSAPARG
ncbi:DUF6962 family protein [Actinopolyspora mortivallis]|uniref:DUF6962 family protein n=1 Tax=Actinopolyspora mortivallis TaxID=33906 RepID=UPI000360C1EC|nr:hypothetical protein [Actinopolyspora mortivallis]